jgi:hypothetical protein
VVIPGVILPMIGLATKFAVIWTLAILAVVAGAIVALREKARHATEGRRRYY